MNINLNAGIALARVIANDNEHGYSQTRRNHGKEGDCSSNTRLCLNAAGFNFPESMYTGNMRELLLAAGFVDVTKSVDLSTGKGLLPMDVCFRPKTQARGGHVVLVLEQDGKEVLQSAGDFDGKPGDSSGKEICIIPIYNSPFKYVFRYMKEDKQYSEPTIDYNPGTRVTGNDGLWYQTELLRIGYTLERMGCKNGRLDGIIGTDTWNMLLYEMQNAGCVRADAKFRTYLKSVPSK